MPRNVASILRAYESQKNVFLRISFYSKVSLAHFVTMVRSDVVYPLENLGIPSARFYRELFGRSTSFFLVYLESLRHINLTEISHCR